MKIIQFLHTREEYEAAARVLAELATLNPTRAEREERERAEFGYPETVAPGGEVSDETQGVTGDETDAPAPGPVAEAPKRRGRPKKEETPAPEPQPAAAAAPEVEDAEIVDDAASEPDGDAPVATRDDMKAAMERYRDKFGMDTLVLHVSKLLGAPRLSAVPEDPEAFQAAIDRFDEAVETGNPEGV